MPTLFDVLTLGMAAWRLAFFLVAEMGPFDVADKFRRGIGAYHESSFQAKLFSCMYCMTFWTGALVLALWATDVDAVRYAISFVAIWGVASLLFEHRPMS